MATFSVSDSDEGRQQLAAGLLVAIVLVLGFLGLRSWWNRPPQIGVDDNVFGTVDALFTAVTTKDDTRLAQCEQRLHDYASAGTLPTAAATRLDEIIKQARGGSWRPAAEDLYEFMSAQRRDE